ncbi:hypothetical protein ACQ4PT_057046 [Festuca glaucescens]
MMSGRLSAGASDDYSFAAMQQQPPPYVGFEHAGMVSGAGGGQRGHQGTMMYDNFDFAAAAAAFGQFQQEAAPHHHQMLALPPPNGAGGLMAPPPMPHGMQLQMPPMPMAMHGGDMYPALGMVKREGGSVGGDAGRIGLNLGRRTYFSPGDMMAVDRMLMRSRISGVFGLGFGGAHHQPPRCQAEGCKADLSGAKHYHRRHKVCEYHAKASLVAAGGKQQRFCQQCSRFHVLTEFDEAKRSCRKRLAEHNRRRRKPAASSNTAGSKDSASPSKKPNAGGAMSGSYTADNNNLSAAKSTISSNTSAISCLQQDQNKVVRPTALTLGAPPAKEDYQLNAMHLQAQADHHHRHQEQQHFITSLLQHNNNGSTNNILSCSSVCSSGLPAAAANGEDSDQNNNDGGNNNNGNMHLFEVDFMFHVLTEVDEAKRSCRKRLVEHNRRRRKPVASSNTAGSKDSAPPSKKPNAGGAMCTLFPSSYYPVKLIIINQD